jgi:hypothetical protein
MKVMLFSGAVPRMPSGVGDYVGELAKALRGRVELVIVTSKSKDVEPFLLAGAKVYSDVVKWGVSDLGSIAKIIRNENPDVFHQQYPSYMGGPTSRALLSNILPIWLKWKFPFTPLITTFHEYGERRLRWRARAFANMKLSDALITITSRDKAILTRWKDLVFRIPIMSNIPSMPLVGASSAGAFRIA